MTRTHTLVLVLASLAVGCSTSEKGSAPTGLPCEVQAILATHCAECHGDTPAFGAPMSLSTQADFVAAALGGERKVHEAVAERIHDTRRPMPPPEQPRLTGAELATLDAYLNGGAKRSDDVCKSEPDAGADEQEVDLSECEELIELRAHAEQIDGDQTPYQVPMVSDHYECFYFGVPWTDKLQALRVDPLLDDKRVLHHWLLYQEPVSSLPGEHNSCLGTHPNATLVAGWAPGGSPYVMPEHVGMQMPAGPDQVFVLEVHYNNSAKHADALDRSGARVCATRTLRENEAATHWLGTDLILLPNGPGSARGVCRPKETAHILSVSPHMHKLGTHLKTIITREDGSVEALLDKPFNFEDQRIYTIPEEVVVGPGDTLDTTCTYDNNTGGLVTFGSATSQEMCYGFVVAYPVGSLQTGGSVLGGGNKCMQ